ncbi:hypothetical protein C789_1684 [Microcystis aeruginosa FACHB-905 = DIANCHI905]|nr:hypothetical protein C789_1684 [Microcystis aeruginosa FACHB-905 = DIANCHI905]
MLRPYRTRADENARFGSTILSKSCTCLARKATKPLPYLHFTFIQPTLNIMKTFLTFLQLFMNV